jgi:hypothetical protein
MDVIAVGVVIDTPTSLMNPYTLYEACMFTDHDTLIPVLIGETRRRLAAGLWCSLPESAMINPVMITHQRIW